MNQIATRFRMLNFDGAVEGMHKVMGLDPNITCEDFRRIPNQANDRFHPRYVATNIEKAVERSRDMDLQKFAQDRIAHGGELLDINADGAIIIFPKGIKY